jgi:hypothetical protein
MSKLKFKPEDFDEYTKGSYPLGMTDNAAIAYFAQRIYDEHLESLPKVYGWPGSRNENYWHKILESYDDKPTHTALLINIEELPKKECEHKIVSQQNDWGNDFRCVDCKAFVRPKNGWEKCDE